MGPELSQLLPRPKDNNAQHETHPSQLWSQYDVPQLGCNECLCVSQAVSVPNTNVGFVDEFVLIELLHHKVW